MPEVKERFEQFPVALENFIKCKVAESQPGNFTVPNGVSVVNNPVMEVMINGVELNQINKLMFDLPELERKKIIANFGIAPKYQVLNNFITDPKTKIRRENIALAVGIARVITESDRIKEGLTKKAGY
jgi:uncharacterized protein Usg